MNHVSDACHYNELVEDGPLAQGCRLWTLGFEPRTFEPGVLSLTAPLSLTALVSQGYSRELFQFEEDRFDNVPALIRFYVGGRRPISQASGAIVFHPITRTLPIRVIMERQKERGGGGGSGGHIMAGGAGGAARARTPMDRCKRRSLSHAPTDMLHLNNPLLRWAHGHLLSMCWMGDKTHTPRTHSTLC